MTTLHKKEDLIRIPKEQYEFLIECRFMCEQLRGYFHTEATDTYASKDDKRIYGDLKRLFLHDPRCGHHDELPFFTVVENCAETEEADKNDED